MKRADLGGVTTPQVNPQVGRLVAVVHGEMTREAIQEAIGIKDRKDFRVLYLLPALATRFLEMTIPDKPNSIMNCRKREGGDGYEIRY